jgi:hypothetical protein
MVLILNLKMLISVEIKSKLINLVQSQTKRYLPNSKLLLLLLVQLLEKVHLLPKELQLVNLVLLQVKDLRQKKLNWKRRNKRLL